MAHWWPEGRSLGDELAGADVNAVEAPAVVHARARGGRVLVVDVPLGEPDG
jgi:hypothetical protein